MTDSPKAALGFGETYFTTTDARFFVGAVALLNSLRLTGNLGEVVILDRGLTESQRRTLRDHASVVDVRDVDLHPFMLKSSINELRPDGVFFWIDSDMIVTESLTELATGAKEGRFYLFQDYSGDRFVPEWQEVFDLKQPLHRQTYLNAGFIAFSLTHGPELLTRWAELCRGIPKDSVLRGRLGNPFWNGDQEALNALFMSEVPREVVVDLPTEEAPLTGWMHRVSIRDRNVLSCHYKGKRVRLLHYVGATKPWMTASWRRINRDAYTRLLIRLLFEEDVPIRLEPREVPVWLRPHLAGRLTLLGLSLVHAPRAWLVDLGRAVAPRLPARVREPILNARARRFHTSGR